MLNYVARWPLIIHYFCAIFCLGASATFHLVWIKNQSICNLFARLDYGGICLLIMGSCYPLTYYVFACEKVFWIRNIFFFINTSSNLSCFCMLMIPRFNKAEYNKVRAGLFIFLGISGVLPFTYLSITEDTQNIAQFANLRPWVVGGAFYIGGALLYANRIPEKKWPGKFDIVGSSH